MEELNIVRPSPLRLNGPVPAKSTLSGRSTPRGGSPSFRRLNSGRTPRRDGKISAFGSQWFRSNRIVLWLLLITLWAYGGFYVQSRWAHGDNKEGIFGGSGDDVANGTSQQEEKIQRILVASEDSLAIKAPSNKTQGNSMDMDVVLAKQGNSLVSDKGASSKKKSKKSTRASRRKTRGKKKVVAEVKNDDIEVQEEEIPKRNTTYGLLVGPFGSIEDKILEWSPEKRSGTCDRKSQFARLVWSRKFVLILHELSMTGAPLAMLELATELLSCGATVYVVPLSKRGGLMSELSRRKIKVLEDKSDLSFKTAMKADLIIAGSAVCASWIGEHFMLSIITTSICYRV